MCVPKPDVPISRATTRCQETTLVRAPANRFDGRRVLAELYEWLVGVQRPNQKLVVVPP